MSHQKSSKSKSPSQRQRRVGEIIREALSEVIQRGDFRDPDLQDANITISEVLPTPDLRVAYVFVMPLGGEEQDKIVIALNRASSYMRRKINNSLRLKFSPELRFELDRTFDEASRIETLLRGIKGDDCESKS
tara:strand:- start:10976 stop:11374 length:399 start_codon:yes stop_codon:yes gene_type:complete